MIGYQKLQENADPQRWIDENEQLTNEALTIEGHPVMERWETPYMEEFAALVTRNGGRILECGFGMGISAGAIGSHAPEEHIIIEANNDVFSRLQAWSQKVEHKVTPIFGLASDVASSFEAESFDGIFYDTYPLNKNEQHTHQFSFIKAAYHSLKPAGVLTYCNLTSTGVLKNDYNSWEELFNQTQVPLLVEAGVPEDDIRGLITFKVYPPKNCAYFQHNTAMIPIIIKG